MKNPQVTNERRQTVKKPRRKDKWAKAQMHKKKHVRTGKN